jgi:1A family penicillin-binding protein
MSKRNSNIFSFIKGVYKNIHRKFSPCVKKHYKKIIYIALLMGFIFIGFFVLWATTIGLPNLDNFDERRVAQSTKILDRTGKVILYDVYGEYKRTIVSLDEISDYSKKATIAIEDKNFYTHNGIEISSIFRAVMNNLMQGNLLGGQGGSTITQQVIKNALLTKEKTITRKVKEWVLAPRLEMTLSKDQILEIYLNEIPFGGSVYGIQEASRRFFAKDAKDLTLTEAAYLAALPQAPTYYSPYGANLDKLESRKNQVLGEMKKVGFITDEDYENAKNETITFQKQEDYGIKAPHFVMYILEKLEKEYGKDVVQEGGLKITTTLDWELQSQAEDIVKKHALSNEKVYNAENGAIVATDPKNGDVLTMVGSRDFFDKEIDGNYNIALAERQPGSAFKPFVYAEAFNKGFRPETIVFDLSTEFSTTCSSGGECYNPGNYDGVYRGPMSLRDALAQSVNVPAVKVLYLAGIKESLNLAKKMGLTTLTNVDQYGLTLVLGGGEVRPLDMSLAYSVFANDGVKNAERTILKIEDNTGKVLFEAKDSDIIGERVLSEQTSRLISDVLTDNVARTPAFGSNSFLNFPNQQVGVKTGTTNDYRDAWIVGYTPNISVAAWAGNNDNSSMEKKVAGFIVAPMWNEFMQLAISKRPVETFPSPEPISEDLKPIMAGDWQSGGVHSILYWVDKDNPLGPQPSNPARDPQFYLWENPVVEWARSQNLSTGSFIKSENHSANSGGPKLNILTIEDGGTYYKEMIFVVAVSMSDGSNIKNGEVLLNGKKLGNLDPAGKSYSFFPQEIQGIKENGNTLIVKVENENGNNFQTKANFNIK